MDTEPHRQVPEIPFRVLIIGRANTGKTSILQRVCETTESPSVYQKTSWGNEPVHGPTILSLSLISLSSQVNLEPSMEVSDNTASPLLPPNHGCSGENTGSMMNLCSPII
jgi:GTPase SAR1 family protein